MTRSAGVPHKRWLKQQRQEHIRAARESATDAEYGWALEQRRGGRVRFRWDVDPEPFVALMSLHHVREQVFRGLESELVVQLRAAGVSWEEIGWALDLSRQAVQKRHPDADREARTLVQGSRAGV